jgi:hypothetical protein
MNKTRAFSALGAAALLVSAGSNAEAQLYQDLGGQVCRLTGVLSYQVSISVSEVGFGISTNVTGTTTLSGNNAGGLTFNNNGNKNDTDLTAAVPLPSFDGINLGTLSATGAFNRNDVEYTSNAFTMTASAATATVPLSLSGFTGTLTVSNPNISFIGGAISAPTRRIDSLIVSDTGTSNEPATLNVGLAGCVNIVGCDTIHFPSYNFTFTSWTLTAIPGPSAVAVFAPGFLGLSGLVMRRRRRRPTVDSGGKK